MTTYDSNLQEIFASHKDKLSDKWSIYLSEYDRLFLEFRERSLNILEIGISHGGSLEIWSKYFSKAKRLIGCDINTNCTRLIYDAQNISIVVGNANTAITYEKILTYAADFDLIIDDGSHRSGDVVVSFSKYFPHLNEGGLYVVEDLHCSYWEGWQGGLHFEQSSMAFFKCLTDIINHEHWGAGQSRGSLLRNFELKYGIELDEEVLSKIHSVEFINSMCIVKKAAPNLNVLGLRLLAGKIPLVDEVPQTPAQQIDLVSDDDLPKIGSTKTTHEHLSLRLSEISGELDDIRRSRSWRWTKPIRVFSAWFR
jgi:O-antigen biosynthesis protein